MCDLFETQIIYGEENYYKQIIIIIIECIEIIKNSSNSKQE